jgi:hypothetical protein
MERASEIQLDDEPMPSDLKGNPWRQASRRTPVGRWPYCTETPSESAGRGWIPGEYECGARADSVSISPLWYPNGVFNRELNDGLDGERPCREASFYCSEHGAQSHWYWIWLVKKPIGQGASICDGNSLAHLVDKGQPMIAFLNWLHDNYDLGPIPEARYGRAGHPRITI